MVWCWRGRGFGVRTVTSRTGYEGPPLPLVQTLPAADATRVDAEIDPGALRVTEL